MKELSLHILDIAQNSVNAKAKTISITIDEQPDKNLLTIGFEDDGCGMDASTLARLNNPFFTTGNKKTGLGIPLLQQHAEAAGGELRVASQPGKGTQVLASFEYHHIDRQPMGDIVGTWIGLIRSYPHINWIYIHTKGANRFVLDLSEVREQLDGLPVNHPEVIQFLKSMMEENLNEL